MTELFSKSKFDKIKEIPAVLIQSSLTSAFLKQFKDYILKIPGKASV
jgi:hypothetical protein